MCSNSKIYILTYGCSANQSESEIMQGILEKEGFEFVENEAGAGIIIINTCIVKRPTETKILYKIKQLDKAGKKLIIAGCMPEVRYKELLKAAPNANFVSTHQIKNIAVAVSSLLKNEKKYFVGKSKNENINFPRRRFSNLIAVIEISKGCLGECTYCSVKAVKGNLQSYPVPTIINEIKSAVSEGCKEIWLTSQDCGCYGKDKGTIIIALLKEIEKLNGDFRIRLGMMNPEHILPILDDLIKCYKNKRVYKFLHVPIQSGSNSVLQRMRRKYRIEDFKKIVSEFRKEIPEINIWTDVIVGFPGETDKEFDETLNLLQEIRPGFFNVSKFGAMKNTPAAKMKQVDPQILVERTRKTSEIWRKITLERNKEQLGKEKNILVTEKGKKGTLKGRDEEFRRVILKENEAKLGELTKKEIISASISSISTF